MAALAGGDVITSTYPGFSGQSVVSAKEFSGLLENPLDTTAVGSSTLTGMVGTAATQTTTQPDELLVGALAVTSPPPAQIQASGPAELRREARRGFKAAAA